MCQCLYGNKEVVSVNDAVICPPQSFDFCKDNTTYDSDKKSCCCSLLPDICGDSESILSFCPSTEGQGILTDEIVNLTFVLLTFGLLYL
jgi:hypothetical protein